MKLFGMKDPLSKLLDSLEQGKGSNLGKTILNVILDLMGYLFLLGILIIIFPMLLPVIILVLLQKPVLLVSTVLESLIHSQSGRGKKLNSKRSILDRTLTPLDYGTRRSRKDLD